MSRLTVVALVPLVACGESKSPPQVSQTRDAREVDRPRAWPAAGAPTLPPELAALAWPPSIDDVEIFEEGRSIDGGVAHGVTIPSTFPRIWIDADLDLLQLEAAWGPLVRDHAGSALWFDPAHQLRARFDVAHPTPSYGRGLELAPYVSTIDRIANLDEIALLAPAASFHIPPGEWDPAPVLVTSAPTHVRFTTRVDAAPVDEAAVLATLREIYGEPDAAGSTWRFAKGRVVVRRIEQFPSVEITFQAR